MRFKIDRASLIVGSEFTVFALFYFVFEGNFPSTSPRGAYIWRGDLMEGFLRYWFGGLIFGGAYFRNFTVCCYSNKSRCMFCSILQYSQLSTCGQPALMDSLIKQTVAKSTAKTKYRRLTEINSRCSGLSLKRTVT